MTHVPQLLLCYAQGTAQYVGVIGKTTAACSLDTGHEADAAKPDAIGGAQETASAAIAVAQGTAPAAKVDAATVHAHDAG
jgi:hypothetical protein